MQYDKAFTDALQFVWGDGFLSPGGPEEVAALLHDHDISGLKVLDIGSGLGGVDALLACRHGAGGVTGIDVEEHLIAAATDLIAAKGLADRVRFQLVEPGPLPFKNASFDLVFSKDAMLHIPDKPSLYADVLRVLKPGGAFIASDWLWGPDASTNPFVLTWVEKAHLKVTFTTPPQAESAMRHAGFEGVTISDRRVLLREAILQEIALLEAGGLSRLAAIIGEEKASERLESPKARLGALDTGQLLPSHLRGRKPV